MAAIDISDTAADEAVRIMAWTPPVGGTGGAAFNDLETLDGSVPIKRIAKITIAHGNFFNHLPIIASIATEYELEDGSRHKAPRSGTEQGVTKMKRQTIELQENEHISSITIGSNANAYVSYLRLEVDDGSSKREYGESILHGKRIWAVAMLARSDIDGADLKDTSQCYGLLLPKCLARYPESQRHTRDQYCASKVAVAGSSISYLHLPCGLQNSLLDPAI